MSFSFNSQKVLLTDMHGIVFFVAMASDNTKELQEYIKEPMHKLVHQIIGARFQINIHYIAQVAMKCAGNSRILSSCRKT